jgi:uncharacterized protein YegL
MSSSFHSEPEDIQAALDVSATQRTPCCLVLDTSGSMAIDGRIDQLNQALQGFAQTVRSQELLRQQVIISVIGFGTEATVLSPWAQADEFVAPQLVANGQTVMGEAMATAHAAVEDLREKMKARGVSYTRPWIFLMSDGGPTDRWQESAAESRRRCEMKRTVVWPFGVTGADPHALHAFARPDMDVYSLENVNFDEIFRWLSSSLGALASSRPGQQLQLPPPPARPLPISV